MVISSKEYARLIEMQTRVKRLHDICDDSLNYEMGRFFDGLSSANSIRVADVSIKDVYTTMGWYDELLALIEEADTVVEARRKINE